MGPGGNGGIATGRVKSVEFEDQGHFVPFQAVKLCDEASYDWMKKNLERWTAENEKHRKDWARIDARQKLMVDNDYRERIADEDWDTEDISVFGRPGGESRL